MGVPPPDAMIRDLHNYFSPEAIQVNREVADEISKMFVGMRALKKNPGLELSPDADLLMVRMQIPY